MGGFITGALSYLLGGKSSQNATLEEQLKEGKKQESARFLAEHELQSFIIKARKDTQIQCDNCKHYFMLSDLDKLIVRQEGQDNINEVEG